MRGFNKKICWLPLTITYDSMINRPFKHLELGNQTLDKYWTHKITTRKARLEKPYAICVFQLYLSPLTSKHHNHLWGLISLFYKHKWALNIITAIKFGLNMINGTCWIKKKNILKSWGEIHNNHFKVINSSAFSTSSMLCNYHLFVVTKHFLTPKRKPHIH